MISKCIVTLDGLSVVSAAYAAVKDLGEIIDSSLTFETYYQYSLL